jgi:hypothetical protein
MGGSVPKAPTKKSADRGVGHWPRLRSTVDRGDIRADPGIAREILEFIEEHQVLSVAMTDGIWAAPTNKEIDYEGEWCPVNRYGAERWIES